MSEDEETQRKPIVAHVHSKQKGQASITQPSICVIEVLTMNNN